MKTEYKYIRMDQCCDTGKTTVWNVNSTSTETCLGTIAWYGAWRKYCFFPYHSTVFHDGCLQDICHFIGQLMAERKAKHTPGHGAASETGNSKRKPRVSIA